MAKTPLAAFFNRPIQGRFAVIVSSAWDLHGKNQFNSTMHTNPKPITWSVSDRV
jgi:hypothetical protein